MKQCEWCNESFSPSRKSVRFCSQSCSSSYLAAVRWGHALTKQGKEREKMQQIDKHERPELNNPIDSQDPRDRFIYKRL